MKGLLRIVAFCVAAAVFAGEATAKVTMGTFEFGSWGFWI